MSSSAVRFAVLAAVRHAAHHVGDYWVQTDHQAAYKGAAGRTGVLACLAHVSTYTATNLAAVTAANRALRLGLPWTAIAAGEAISAVTHYAADRRTHGALHWLVNKLEPASGKSSFVAHGGLPYLDQAWHHAANAIAAGVTATAASRSQKAAH